MKRQQRNGRRKWNNQSFFGHCWVKAISLTFDEISQIIKKNMWPKKKVSHCKERAMDMRQEADKLVTKFLLHLTNVSWYWKTQTEELIQKRLIDGLHNATYCYKMLEQLQLENMSLTTCTEFIQQQLIIKYAQIHIPYQM